MTSTLPGQNKTSQTKNSSPSTYTTTKHTRFKIKCIGGSDVSEKSGFHFQNVHTVSIINLIFQECGHPESSNVWLHGEDKPVSSWSALSFNNSHDIYLENNHFIKSHGYGTTLHNCYGDLTFDSLTYRDNKLMEHHSRSTQQVGLLSNKFFFLNFLLTTMSRSNSINFKIFIDF